MVTHMHVAFKVEDYERWKKEYDASIDLRKANGEISFKVLRNVDDPCTVTVVSVQQSLEKVKAFLESDEIRARIKQGMYDTEEERFVALPASSKGKGKGKKAAPADKPDKKKRKKDKKNKKKK